MAGNPNPTAPSRAVETSGDATVPANNAISGADAREPEAGMPQAATTEADPAEASPTEAAGAEPRMKTRFGIGPRLYLAFGGMTMLTVVAAGIAVAAFSGVGRTLDAVTERSIPAVTATLRLAVNSANVAATAPGLISATTEDGRSAVKAQLQSSLTAIDMELEKIAETDA